MEDDLYDERDAVAGLRVRRRLGPVIGKKGKPTQIRGRSISLSTAGDGDRQQSDELHIKTRSRFGEVVAVDRVSATIDVEKGPSRADVHPSAVFAFKLISERRDGRTPSLRIGEAVAEGLRTRTAPRARCFVRELPASRVRRASLRRTAKRRVDFAVRVAGDLDGHRARHPGTARRGQDVLRRAHDLRARSRRGSESAITATSHKVIRNLARRRREGGRTIGHRVRLGAQGWRRRRRPRRTVAREVADGNADGARCAAIRRRRTSSAERRGCGRVRNSRSAVDVLFVDEAGQMSLANVLAVSQAANSVVLLGDPQQLEQPRKGSHPDGVDVSALEHMLGGTQTIPPDRGIFLPVTWRLVAGDLRIHIRDCFTTGG